MGTSKSGRYLNTVGSARSVSDFAKVHVNEGTFNHPNCKRGDELRLIGGGHGESGMQLLIKYGIKFKVVKTYSNGVRVGYVENHRDKRKRSGINQSWFPASWDGRKIKRAAEHVACLNRHKNWPDGKPMYGTYKGVRVGVIKTKGQISTAFPDSKQPE